MPNITLSLTNELKKDMDLLPELNWSEMIRGFLLQKVKRVLLLKKLDKMLENSELTEEQCLKLGEKAKQSMLRRYSARGW
ncbi:MAG: hypothetical protein KKG60_02730 [Nanoarchaeota archaeon]|nr:hypothetical protein [Nanoarchaeota archaeon]